MFSGPFLFYAPFLLCERTFSRPKNAHNKMRVQTQPYAHQLNQKHVQHTRWRQCIRTLEYSILYGTRIMYGHFPNFSSLTLTLTLCCVMFSVIKLCACMKSFAVSCRRVYVENADEKSRLKVVGVTLTTMASRYIISGGRIGQGCCRPNWKSQWDIFNSSSSMGRGR